MQEFEKIVAIPIFKDDTYEQIAQRFLEAFGDDDLVDGYFMVNKKVRNV